MGKSTIIQIVVLLIIFIMQPAVYALDVNLYFTKSWYELDDIEKEEISRATERYIALLKDGSYENAYEISHPEFKKATSESAFLELTKFLKPRFAKATSITIFDARMVFFKIKAANEFKIIFSGSAKQTDPKHIQFYAVPGIKKQGLVFYNIESDTVDRLLTLRVGIHDNSYKILSLSLNATNFKGKGAEYFENLGSKWADQKMYVTSMLAYLMALKFSVPGKGIHTANSIRIGKRIADLLKDSEIKSQLISWRIGKDDYKIIKYDTFETINDVTPTLAYISKYKLEEKEITKETNVLSENLIVSNPEFSKHFEALLFRAYLENPVSPQKEYNFYRKVVRIN